VFQKVIIMNEQAQILVKDKWGSWIKGGETLYDAALELLTERLEQGFWYDNWDSGNPHEQYKDRAEHIIEDQDGEAAWNFLYDRSDHEYEYVEEALVK
jgi:hypothetical protein